MSLNARLVPEYLIRCDLNEMLKHKNMLDVKRKKWKRKKNGREEFKELNIEAVSQRWFEKLLKLVWDIWFMSGYF